MTPPPEQTIGVCSALSPSTRASLVFARPVAALEKALDLSHHSRTRPPSPYRSTITTLPVFTPPAMTPQWAFQCCPLTCTYRCHCTCGACCPCQCVCQPEQGIKESRFWLQIIQLSWILVRIVEDIWVPAIIIIHIYWVFRGTYVICFHSSIKMNTSRVCP